MQLHYHWNFQKTHYPQNMCTKRECESEYNELLERIKKQRGSIIEYIANTAENSFNTDKVLIISWVYRYNCTITETSKNALSWDICTVPWVEQSVSVPLTAAFQTQSFVCLIANTPLWQKRKGVRKEGARGRKPKGRGESAFGAPSSLPLGCLPRT